jgi:hypothetical protein
MPLKSMCSSAWVEGHHFAVRFHVRTTGMMSRGSIGRIILAVVASYLADGILVEATELALRPAGIGTRQPLHYFVIDLSAQCLYTVCGGYLCCLIAGPTQRAALAGLMGLGLVVGTGSLIASWKTEPHWYGIALLAVYPPCVWVGWTLRDHGQRMP